MEDNFVPKKVQEFRKEVDNCAEFMRNNGFTVTVRDTDHRGAKSISISIRLDKRCRKRTIPYDCISYGPITPIQITSWMLSSGRYILSGEVEKQPILLQF